MHFLSKNTLGWLVDLSIDGKPNSVNHIGFERGTHDVTSPLGFL